LKDKAAVTVRAGVGPNAGHTVIYKDKEYKLRMFCPVDERGMFTKEGGKYASIFVKDADKLIIDDLGRKGLLLRFKRTPTFKFSA
jgi:isoleucyl-tRNA synthetase